MTIRNSWFWQASVSAWLLISVAVILTVHAQSPAKNASAPKAPSEAQKVELRGRVVCLAEEMHRLYQADLSTQHEHQYGFKTNDGRFFTLLRTKYSEALFADKRLHEKELLLNGRLFPDTQIFEPISLRSVRGGVVNDILYHCGVCEIYAVAPGICECCQDPMELQERPVPQERPTVK
jgi:hypothetical protein